MKLEQTHSTRLGCVLPLLFALCSVSQSQDRDNFSKSHGCAAQIRSLKATILSAPDILSRLVETNEVTVSDYAGSGTSVTVEVVVGAGGSVLCIDNVRGHPLLSGPVVDSVSKWHFNPLLPAGANRARPFHGDLTVSIKRSRD